MIDNFFFPLLSLSLPPFLFWKEETTTSRRLCRRRRPRSRPRPSRRRRRRRRRQRSNPRPRRRRGHRSCRRCRRARRWTGWRRASCCPPPIRGSRRPRARSRRRSTSSRRGSYECVYGTTQPPTVVRKMEAQLQYIHTAYTFLHNWRRFVCSVGAY